LYLMTLALLRNERRFAYAAGGALLVAFVTRPTAWHLLLPFAIVLAARGRPGALRRLTLRVLVALPLIAVAAVAVLSVIARRQIAVSALRHVIERYRSGTVIVGRPETLSCGGFLMTFLRRLVAFFSFSAQGFSSAHVIVATLYFVPLYAAALAGVVALFRRRTANDTREIVACVALLTAWP